MKIKLTTKKSFLSIIPEQSSQKNNGSLEGRGRYLILKNRRYFRVPLQAIDNSYGLPSDEGR